MEVADLTNEADFLLCSLYNEYLEKRKADVFRGKAVFFGTAEMVQREVVKT